MTVSPAVINTWLGHAPHYIFNTKIFDISIRLPRELLRVSTAIAALGGLYYSIAVLTDSTYRQEFLSELTGEMDTTFQQRREYLRLLDITRDSQQR